MNPETPVKDITFVAFDFETTGLNSRADRIIEIGAVKFKDGHRLGEFVELVNPGVPHP